MQIQVFATHLYTRRSTGLGEGTEVDYRGYVDVGFSIDSLGNASELRSPGRIEARYYYAH